MALRRESVLPKPYSGSVPEKIIESESATRVFRFGSGCQSALISHESTSREYGSIPLAISPTEHAPPRKRSNTDRRVAVSARFRDHFVKSADLENSQAFFTGRVFDR